MLGGAANGSQWLNGTSNLSQYNAVTHQGDKTLTEPGLKNTLKGKLMCILYCYIGIFCMLNKP